MLLLLSANLAAFLTARAEPSYWASMQEAADANARICIDPVILHDVQARFPKATLQAFDFYSPDLVNRYATARCDALAYRRAHSAPNLCAVALGTRHAYSVVTWITSGSARRCAHSFDYVAQADSLVGTAVCDLKLMTAGVIHQVQVSLPALATTAPALSYAAKNLWETQSINVETVRQTNYPSSDPCDLYPPVVSTDNELQPLTIRNFVGARAAVLPIYAQLVGGRADR